MNKVLSIIFQNLVFYATHHKPFGSVWTASNELHKHVVLIIYNIYIYLNTNGCEIYWGWCWTSISYQICSYCLCTVITLWFNNGPLCYCQIPLSRKMFKTQAYKFVQNQK